MPVQPPTTPASLHLPAFSFPRDIPGSVARALAVVALLAASGALFFAESHQPAALYGLLIAAILGAFLLHVPNAAAQLFVRAIFWMQGVLGLLMTLYHQPMGALATWAAGIGLLLLGRRHLEALRPALAVATLIGGADALSLLLFVGIALPESQTDLSLPALAFGVVLVVGGVAALWQRRPLIHQLAHAGLLVGALSGVTELPNAILAAFCVSAVVQIGLGQSLKRPQAVRGTLASHLLRGVVVVAMVTSGVLALCR